MKGLRILYWLLLVIAIAILLVSYGINHNEIGDATQFIVLQTAATLLTIVSVPLIVKLSDNRVTSSDSKIFTKWNLLRMATPLAVFVICLLTYHLVKTDSSIICAVVCVLVFATMCRPGKNLGEKKEESKENEISKEKK